MDNGIGQGGQGGCIMTWARKGREKGKWHEPGRVAHIMTRANDGEEGV